MKHAEVDIGNGFEPVLEVGPVQAATMGIAPGESVGDRDNRHQGSDQWLYVLDGEGEAQVEGRTLPLRRGTLLAIERGESHQLRNTGATTLKTLNFYSPPAWAGDGDPLPAGRG